MASNTFDLNLVVKKIIFALFYTLISDLYLSCFLSCQNLPLRTKFRQVWKIRGSDVEIYDFQNVDVAISDFRNAF